MPPPKHSRRRRSHPAPPTGAAAIPRHLAPTHRTRRISRPAGPPPSTQAYLNYHYGITLEEALQLAAEESVRKRHTARGYPDTEELIEQAFRHLYNNTRTSLFQEFTQHPDSTPIYPELVEGRPGLSLTGLKEFTYWLHKRRVNYWDPARVASDTRLAIRRLAALQETAAPQSTQNIRAD